MLSFGTPVEGEHVRLNGAPVDQIHANLTAGAIDITRAAKLRDNETVAFQGVTKGGAFEISADIARRWLALPLNPNGRANTDVIRPIISGGEITERGLSDWVIDFGDMSETDAAFYQARISQMNH